jgi:DNA-binding transcriptional regulator GbsR (MarR family)
MKLSEAKQQFVASWGAFASNWGINKTMAQVHAHLLVSPDALDTDQLMEQLQMSRGNVNLNVRELIDWGLVERVTKTGVRKDLFVAEQDIWKVVKLIIHERKRRELDPMLRLMRELQDVQADKNSAEYKTFKNTVEGIIKFSEQADKTLDRIVKSDESWFWSNFLKLLK